MANPILAMFAVLILVGAGVYVYTGGFQFASVQTSTGQTCQLATPVFGVLRCVSLGVTEAQALTMTQLTNSEAKGSYSCLSNCQLNSYSDISFDQSCSQRLETEILVSGISRAFIQNDRGTVRITSGSFPVQFSKGQEITVRAWCDDRFLFAGSIKAATGRATLQKTAIRLQEEQAGILPAVNLQGTNDCNWNTQLTNTYKELKQAATAYFDVNLGRTTYPPQGAIADLNNAPTNWAVGDNYVFTRAYQTSSALNFQKDANGNIIWAGGTAGNRQIYSVGQVTSQVDGSCYLIPQSIQRSVECVFPTDCNYKGVGYTCDTTSFSCQKTSPCNSDLECGSIYGTAQCINKVVDGWTCDLSKPSGSKAGSCLNTRKTVLQCPSECTGSQFYNSQSTKCEDINQLQDVPAGKCSVPGGPYKQQSCSFGLACCPDSGSSYLGTCKTSCDTNIQACGTDSDCNDFDPATVDKCELNTLTGNKCTHVPRVAPPAAFDLGFWGPILLLIFAMVIAGILIAKKKR